MVESLFASVCLLVFTGGIPNPIWAWWRCTRGAKEMPLDVQARALRIAPVVPILGHVLLIVLLLWLFGRGDDHFHKLLAVPGLRSSLSVGACAGIAWLSLYLLVFAITKPGIEALSKHDLIKNHPRYWAPATVLSAVSEELWRALVTPLGK